ncbi:TPA: DNA cytosine methyltransferase, partial [Staphylococcus pseudintermedius]|nr:DNA cytosine methyltransferase [Staphylococcus pseudintermedius]
SMKTYFNQTNKEINTKAVSTNTEVEKLNIVSLFSGAGGMDLGFKGGFEYLGEEYSSLPFNLVFANDIFSQAADVYEINFNHKVERRSITDIKESELPNVPVDVVLGGFPCQSFSYSGNRGGLSDPRGQLYLQMIRVINHYKPKLFVAENVDGIRNSRKNHKGENVDTTALDTILQDFDDANYDVQYKVLNAADYGVPQSRRRVIIIGIRKDLGSSENVYYPEAQYNQNGVLKPYWRTSKEGIDDLWDKINDLTVFNHTYRDYSKAKFYPGKKTQGNVRISPDKPAPTIRAEHHGNIEAHYRTLKDDELDMTGWRRLSVRECARLQSFPDNYNFVASTSSSYKMIGNAVPPVMAWHIAKSVLYTLEKLKLLKSIPQT